MGEHLLRSHLTTLLKARESLFHQQSKLPAINCLFINKSLLNYAQLRSEIRETVCLFINKLLLSPGPVPLELNFPHEI